MQCSLPYRLVGGKSLLKYAALKDCLAYLQLTVHPSTDVLALDRVLNVPARKLGPKSAGHLRVLAAEHGVTLNELLLEDLEVWKGPPPPTPANMPLPPRLVGMVLGSGVVTGVKELRHTICTMRAACMLGMPLGQPLRELLRCTNYMEHARAASMLASKGRKRSAGKSAAELMEERVFMLMDKMDADCEHDGDSLPALVRAPPSYYMGSSTMS